MKILIVDDEKIALTSIRRVIRRKGFTDIAICDDGLQAIDLIKNNCFDVVLLDLMMPNTNGLKVLDHAKALAPDTEFIILTALEDTQMAAKAVHMGAYDYIVKPINNDRLVLSLKRAYEKKELRTTTDTNKSNFKSFPPLPFNDFITKSQQMKELIAYAEIIANSHKPILITGESGTGKKLLARCIHKAGPHSKGPFIAVNVSSIPKNLFEGRFFGYSNGVIKSSEPLDKGYFEQSNEGTLFLDNIEEIPDSQQSKLLRVIDEKSILKTDDTSPIDINIQIISATNQDLDKRCNDKLFERDLLLRLNSEHIHIPPLRERQEDIIPLAEHFLKEACISYNKSIIGFDKDTTDFLLNWHYPDNVRELAHMIKHAVSMTNGSFIEVFSLREKNEEDSSYNQKLISLKEAAEIHTAFVLSEMKGDRKKAARILGISVRQVQRKISQMKNNPKWNSLISNISSSHKNPHTF